MKKYILFPVLALMLAACGEDYAEKGLVKDSDIDPVIGAEATPFVGAVILGWDIPETSEYYYTMVEYTDANGETVKKKVSKYSVDPENPNRIKTTIGGFTDTNEYTFTLTHYTFAGNPSEKITVSAAPEDRHKAKDYLVKDITFEPIVEGFNMRWKNDLDAKVKIVYEYLDITDERMTKEVDATVPKVESVERVPIETDIVINYYMVDLETEEKSETLTKTIQVLPTVYDIYDPTVTYIPDSYYGINMCTVEWNDTKNEYVVKTSGTDPFIYTQLPGAPTGNKLVFRYKTEKNITGIEIFLNGRAPAPANSAAFPGIINPATGKLYKGLPKTKYWMTVVWDLSKDLPTKYDEAANKNKIRIDFGGQNTRELHIRNMHWE